MPKLSDTRTRSGTPASLPDGEIFFVDRDLGAYKFPNALRAAGLRVEVHAERYADETIPDDVWVSDSADNGWTSVTADRSARRDHLFFAAMERSGARVVIVNGGGRTAERNAAIFLKHLKWLRAALAKNEGRLCLCLTESSVRAYDYNQRRMCVVLKNGKVRWNR